jgi:hypothetical protein
MVPTDSGCFWQLRLRQQELGVQLTRQLAVITALLIAALFVGSMAGGLRSFFVTNQQPPKEKLGFVKIQDRLIAEAEPATAPVSLQTFDVKAPVSVDEVEAFSVSNIHPTDGFIMPSKTPPASSSQEDSGAGPSASLQSKFAAGPHAVPLPRRKPKRHAKEAHLTTAVPKPIDRAQSEQLPKPMAFGSIGYNYNPPR